MFEVCSSDVSQIFAEFAEGFDHDDADQRNRILLPKFEPNFSTPFLGVIRILGPCVRDNFHPQTWTTHKELQISGVIP